MYNDRRGGYNNRPTGYGASGPRGGAQASPRIIQPEPLPEDYVKRAEEAIVELKRMEDNRQRPITTSKLRSLFSLFTDIFNDISRGDQEKLDRDQVGILNAAKVRIYYEIGREEQYRGNMSSGAVGRFVQQSNLLAYLGDIGDSCEKLMRFYHYMEALVAFHRFYFGEQKDRF